VTAPPNAAASTVWLARGAALLAWYHATKRAMPWRRAEGKADAYAVLVSELMLQQTRVDTVVPYFTRWMVQWPTLADLAAATTDEVLAAWTGLGYYNRARNLHRAAIQCVATHGGRLPESPAALAALPGVGPYTQGAIRSIAFSQPAALVDGNVARVLSRWHATHEPTTSTQGKRQLWAWAEAIISTEPAVATPGDWNQALMELGATCCTARSPACERCPVAPWCAAHSAGLAADLPVRAPKKKPKPVAATYLLWRRPDGYIWCGQRPARGRWAGLWEPPGAEGPGADATVAALLPSGLSAHVLPGLVHVLTHRRYAVTPWLVDSALPPPDLATLGYAQSRWVAPSAASELTSGLSRLAARLLEAAG